MSTSQEKSLADFVALKSRQGVTHAIRAAAELGIFRALQGGQRTCSQLATELDVDPVRLGRLLNVLVFTELIERYGDDYALSALARLIPESYYDFGDHAWRHLVDHLKTGRSVDAMPQTDLSDLDYQIQQAGEEWTLTPVAITAARVLDLGGTRSGLKLLQLGCGSAVFGVTLAHADPSSHLTLVDTPAEIRRAQATVDSVELNARTTLVEAENWRDFEILDLSGQADAGVADARQFVPQPMFDLVILSGKVHLQPLEELAPLFRKIGSLLLKRDGELALIDVFPGQPAGARQQALHELEFGLRHSHGTCHHPRDLQSTLRRAGFKNLQYAHLPAEPHQYGLLLAEKE